MGARSMAVLVVLVLDCGATTTGTRPDAAVAEDVSSLDVAAGMDASALEAGNEAGDVPAMDVTRDIVVADIVDRASDDGCALSCSDSQTRCGCACHDLMSDPENCGTCGRACCLGTVCNIGRCIGDCNTGMTFCGFDWCTAGGSCRDLQTDQGNCGACGHACPAGNVCSGGACTHSYSGDGGLTDATTDASVRCAPRPWPPPPPVGVCDGVGRMNCTAWAVGLVAAGVSYGGCLGTACVPADRCPPAGDPPTCYCGTGPSCRAGEVCAAAGPGEVPHCQCGAAP